MTTDVETILLRHRADQLAARANHNTNAEWLAEKLLNNWLEHWASLGRLRTTTEAR